MLWVTTATVYFFFSVSIRSSIFAVEMGSRAEVGSSISSTSGSTAKIEDLMESLKQKYTVVVVTHNMQQATRVSDYTAFFLLGELIEFGKTRQVFSYPREKKTEDYITGRFG